MTAVLDAAAIAGFALACHSTLAVLIAWAASRWMQDPADRACLWRAAILVPVATVALQAAVPGALWSVGDRGDPGVAAAAAEGGPIAIARKGRTVTVRIDAERAVPPAPARRLQKVARAAAAIWLAGVGFSSIHLAAAAVAHWRLLRSRRPVEEGAILSAAARLATALGLPAVRVTVSDMIDVPSAVGREVCLPARAIRELSAAEVRAVLAHEIAHIGRHDPVMLRAIEIVRTLAWWNPLVRWARQQFRRDIEFCCDDLAASCSGGGLVVARALRTVSEWRVADSGALRVTAASAGEQVYIRVARLLAPAAPAPRRLTPVTTVAALIAAACLMLPTLRLAPYTMEIHTEGARLWTRLTR